MREEVHRGTVVSLIHLQAHCWSKSMAVDMELFVRQCLCCVDTLARKIIPRPNGETALWSVTSDALQFYFLYSGESGPIASDVLPEDSGFRDNPVMMDDLTDFACLEPSQSCTVEVTARHLLLCSRTLKVPRV